MELLSIYRKFARRSLKWMRWLSCADARQHVAKTFRDMIVDEKEDVPKETRDMASTAT